MTDVMDGICSATRRRDLIRYRFGTKPKHPSHGSTGRPASRCNQCGFSDQQALPRDYTGPRSASSKSLTLETSVMLPPRGRGCILKQFGVEPFTDSLKA